ncbi:MAG: mechanosensitive ion channel family protein [Nanoarchaeota archaeon]|nr:mechanosensitive ion channel family protein [Nanoarchaeota archaeon]
MFELSPDLIFQVGYTIAALAGAWIVNRVVRRAVKRFAARAKIDVHTTKPILTLLRFVIYVGALIMVLGVWGLEAPLAALLTGAGVAGIVIGFATKDAFADILAGLMLFFDRPFKINETIMVADVGGTVTDIGLRSTKIKTFDGKHVVIPNNTVAKSLITNLSKYNNRRLELSVGIDYDNDIKKAKAAIQRAIIKLQKVGMIEQEGSKILIDAFGASSIDFKIFFWYSAKYVKDRGIWFTEIKAELIDNIKHEFDKAGISIPFPQVTLSERRKKKV